MGWWLLAAISLQPAFAAEVTFRDDFDSPSLGAGWQVVHENPANLSLTARPGFLRISTERGALEAGSQVSNLVLREASGDFIIESRVEFDPRAARQFAGIAVYSSDEQAVALGLAFASGERGTFRGIVLLSVGEDSGPSQRPGERYDETTADNPNIVFLRLLRAGDLLVAGFSPDGINYTDIGSITNTMPPDVLVGVGAANGDFDECGADCDASIPADFDFFQISSLTDGGGNGGADVPIVEALVIEAPDEVDAGGTIDLDAIAEFSDGSSIDVTVDVQWLVAPPDLGEITNGLFQAANVDETNQVTLAAIYTQLTSGGDEVTVQATKVVRINADNSGSPTSPRSCPALGGLMLLMTLVPMWLLRTLRR